MWHDYQMQWNREKYGGIASIRVPPSQVWTPDVNDEASLFIFQKLKFKNNYFRLFYLIMLMENTKYRLNLML